MKTNPTIQSIAAAISCRSHQHSTSPPTRYIPGMLLATGVALCAGSTTVHAQAWATVDDIVDPASSGYAATSDSAGNLFDAGSMNMIGANGVLNYAVVMESLDPPPSCP